MIFEIKCFQPLNGVRDKVLDLIWLWIQSHLYHSDNKENCTTWCIDYCLKCCVNTSKVSFLGKGEARLGHISVTMIQLLNVYQMYSQICEFYSVFSAFLSSFDPSFVALYDHMSRDHICHKQYKQRLCKIIITRVKVHFVDVF